MSNEVTTTSQQDIELQEVEDLSGLSSVVKIRATNLVLVQNTTQDPKSARPGQILDELSGQGFDSIVLVPMRVSKGRVMFAPGSGFGGDPICRSNDGVSPDKRIVKPGAAKCNICRYSKWIGKQKPPCSEKVRFMAIMKETGLPRWFQATGKGITPTMDMLENISQNIVSANKTATPGTPRLNLYDFYFTLSGEKVVNSTGVFFVPRYEKTFRVANIGEFAPLYKEFVVDEVAEYRERMASEQLTQIDGAVTETITGAFDVPFEQV